MLEETNISIDSSVDEMDSAFGGSFMSRRDEAAVAISNWSPDSIPHCESCLKHFTFRRRRHHCRKCGCIVCYKCSSQSVVIPRLGKGLQRVCDSCYNNVHCDPCSNLVDDCIEANLKARMRSNTVRVGVITTCDVVVQSIVQGLSMAMTGSPLGKEIDVECFPSPPLFQQQLLRGMSASCGPTSPDAISLPSGYQSRHSITPSSLSAMSLSRSRADVDGLRRDIFQEASPAHSPIGQNAATQSTSRYIRSDADSRASALEKARLAFDMYEQRFNTSPDFSVGVVFGVCVDDYEGWLGPRTGLPTASGSGEWGQAGGGGLESHTEVKHYSVIERVPYDLTGDGSVIPDGDTELSSGIDNRTDGDFTDIQADVSGRGASLNSTSHMKMYQMFYWVVIYDGEKLNSSRSSSISLPPSLCAHIQKRERDFARRNEHDRSKRPSALTAMDRSPSSTPITIFDCDIDVEEELVAAILREGDAASASSSASLSRPPNALAITNALSGGIVGWLTGGRITRASYLQSVIQLAYMPFQWKHLYEVADV